jgi:hypothetical protein
MASTSAASAALPEALQPSQSILAPILVGFQAAETGKTIVPSVSTACNVVPAVTLMRKHLVGRKAVIAPHTRSVVWVHNAEWPDYNIIARCVDQGPEQTLGDAFKSWIWEVSVLPIKEGAHPGLIPEDWEQVRLDVTRYRIQNQGVLGAHQLVLFRHLFVESFRAIHRDAVVFGGQHDWSPERWPNPTTPAEQ